MRRFLPGLTPVAGIVSVALASCSFAASGASAQATFGTREGQVVPGAGGVVADGQQLQLSADLGGGVDALSGVDRATGAAVTQRRGVVGSASGSVNYSVRRGWFGAAASASSVARQFWPGIGRPAITNFGGGGASIDVPISGRLSLAGQAQASYQPVSFATLFPGAFQAGGSTPAPTDFDLGSPLGRQVNRAGDVSLSYAVSRRAGLSAGYVFQQTSGALGAPTQENRGARVNYRHAITRAVGFRLGYGLDTSRRAAVADTPALRLRQHLIDIGVDLGLGRSMTLTRRLTLGVSTGTALLSDGRRHHFDVVGNATVSYLISRAWTASTGYVRGAQFVQAFGQATFSNSLAADLQGSLGTRVQLVARTGVASGRIGLGNPSTGYFAYQSLAGSSFRVHSLVSLTVNYVYYRFRFDGTSLLPTALGTELRRHSLQAGTSISLSFFDRTRSRNAAR